MKKILLTISLITLTLCPVFSASWEIQQARQEYAQGAYSKCLATLNAATTHGSENDVELYKLRAQAYMKLNSPISAIKDFDKAIELRPTWELYEQRGFANLKAKKYNETLEDFIKIIEVGDRSLGVTFVKEKVKNFKIIVNDNATPLAIKYQALQAIADINKAIYGNGSAEHLIPQLKIVQLIANLDENNKIFEKQSKKEFIEELRQDSYKKNSSESEYSMGREAAIGYFEYAVGNKELGKKIVYGVINEWKTRESDEYDKVIENDAVKIFKALDTPGIQ